MSEVGNAQYTIAYMWWVAQRTHSPGTVSLIVLLSMLPGVLLGILGGGLTDRYRKKVVLVVGDALRGVIMFGVALLGYTGQLTVYLFFVIATLLSVVNAFFRPAYSASVPHAVGKDLLVKANSLTSMSRSLSGIIGPVIGGVVTATVNANLAFLLNAISFLFAAFCESGMRLTGDNPGGAGIERPAFLVVLKRSFSTVFREPAAVTAVGMFAAVNFLVTPVIVLLPFLAQDLHASSAGYGVLRMAEAAGILLVSMLFGTVSRTIGSADNMVRVGLALTGGGILSVGLQTEMLGTDVSLFVSGIGIGVLGIYLNTIVQTRIPKEHLGMVFGLRGTLTDFLMPVGLLLSGLMASYLSLSSLLESAGTGLLLLLIPTAWLSARGRKELSANIYE